MPAGALAAELRRLGVARVFAVADAPGTFTIARSGDGMRPAGDSRASAAGSHPLSGDSRRTRDMSAEALAVEGIPIEVAESVHDACVMAAVTGDLGDAPGIVVLDRINAANGSATLAALQRDRSDLVVLDRDAMLARASGPSAVAGALPASPTAPGARAGSITRASRSERTPSAAVLDALGDLIARSTRPIVVVGRHARRPDDCAWLRAFAETLPAPVITTWQARGALPEPHPLALGVVGMNDGFFGRADFVLTLGLDPVEIESVEWRSEAPVATVTSSPGEALPFRGVLDITGDVAAVLEELAPRLKGRTRADWDVAELDRAKRALTTGPGLVAVQWKRQPLQARDESVSRAELGSAEHVVSLVREATPAGTIAAVEHAWREATLGWQCTTPGQLLAPLRADLTPYAIAAAVAARLARPEHPIVAFTDARALSASLTALRMAIDTRLGFVVVVLTPVPPAVLDDLRALGAHIPIAPGAPLPAADIATLASGSIPVVIPAA